MLKNLTTQTNDVQKTQKRLAEEEKQLQETVSARKPTVEKQTNKSTFEQNADKADNVLTKSA